MARFVKGMLRPAPITVAHMIRAGRRNDGAASKAAKAKRSPRSEVEDIKATLADLARKVEEGKMDRTDASVSGQLWNLVMRGIELQRKLREFEDFEKRLEALEAQWQLQKRSWR